jgi:MFS family permease
MGGLLSPTAALMNLWTPPNTQGATYALDNSVAAAGRSISPMIAAGVATWIGVRGVFGITAVVYVAIAGLVLWMAQRMRERAAQEQLAPAD